MFGVMGIYPFLGTIGNSRKLRYCRLRMLAIGDDHLVKGSQISFCAGDDDIGIRAVPAKGAGLGGLTLGVQAGATWIVAVTITTLDADSHLAESVNPFRDGMYRKFQ